MSVAIVWFRRDLRLADNPALCAAAASSDQVLALYIHAPGEETPWQPGAATRWWLHHALAALDASLRARGGALLIKRGDSSECLREALAESGATSLHWNRRYEPAVIARDQRIKETMRERGVDAHSHNALLLVEPWTVATQQDAPYRVFTPFWRNAAQRAHQHLPSAVPQSLRLLAAPSMPGRHTCTLDQLGLLPSIAWDAAFPTLWQPGEAGAQARLADFLDDSVDGYAAARDQPDHAGTSRLSPYLATGELSPRQILAAIHDRDAEGPGFSARAQAYVRQLGWREFCYHLLFHFPQTTVQNLNRRFDSFPWADPDATLLRAWQQGRTGIPLVDAGMRELWHTGWMHNRVRMVVGSLLTKNLRYHWQHGARWFWDTLLDADLANNTQGWQWIAGTGADAAPYFRVFNPVLQGERFDPSGHYVRRHVPELARVPDRYIHQPWSMSPIEQAECGIAGTPYARPLIDLAASRDAALLAYQSIRQLPD